ncbi:MAG: hypothetical protein ACFE9Q_11350 [Candidatus Hodarchaeota archaeon]
MDKNYIDDMKLKNLIQICKQTKNYKKLAVVSFILTSNRLDEIGINLGVKPRKRSSGETLFQYMTSINQIFDKNLQIHIFKDEQIDIVRDSEALFLRNKGEIPIQYIKAMFNIYFDLCKLEVPNLHKTINNTNFMGSSYLELFSFLSPGIKHKQNDVSTLKPLIIQKIKNLEQSVQKDLDNEFNAKKLEKSIALHSIRNSIDSKGKRGISIQGPLKKNLIYQNSIKEIYKYFLFGLIILTISLGLIISIEISYFPAKLGSINTWSLVFCGTSAILIFIYIKLFRKECI